MHFKLSCGMLVAASAGAYAGSLKDIKHIVLFMQENRSFDHYFGTMAGVRGFADPNVQVNEDGRSVFEQQIKKQNGVNTLKPWHFNYLGGEWINATQCGSAGDNGWYTMHATYNYGLNNNWAATNPYNLAYYKYEDVPTQWDIAQGWTVMDMGHASTMTSTNPNRMTWMSGSNNVPGNPTNPDGKGSIVLVNPNTPGCDAKGNNCFPLNWRTFPEDLEAAGISWKVWQDRDNFQDNMLAYFKQYQEAPKSSPLTTKGNSYPGLDAFYKACADDTLPAVSWIIGPAELSEHASFTPGHGAWLQKQITDAIVNSPSYKSTALFINYDESGGFMDHVTQSVPPEGTPGEWFEDPDGYFGKVPVGPGPRIPRYIVSPWTRGGHVFTEISDHISDLLFIEEWAKAHGYTGLRSKAITQWRRDHMSNMVNAFDFDNPDYSKYSITGVPKPSKPSGKRDGLESRGIDLGDYSGPWIGAAECQNNYPSSQPPVPYGSKNANLDLKTIVQNGFKAVRGRLTEGRYLTLEMSGMALTNGGKSVTATAANSHHDKLNQRWILHAVNGDQSATNSKFYLQSASDKKYIGRGGALTTDKTQAQSFTITYTPNGATHSLSPDGKSFVAINQGKSVQWNATSGKFKKRPGVYKKSRPFS